MKNARRRRMAFAGAVQAARDPDQGAIPRPRYWPRSARRVQARVPLPVLRGPPSDAGYRSRHELLDASLWRLASENGNPRQDQRRCAPRGRDLPRNSVLGAGICRSWDHAGRVRVSLCRPRGGRCWRSAEFLIHSLAQRRMMARSASSGNSRVMGFEFRRATRVHESSKGFPEYWPGAYLKFFQPLKAFCGNCRRNVKSNHKSAGVA